MIRQALAEDQARKDRTTHLLIPKHQKARGLLVAKRRAVLAGFPVFSEVFRCLDPRVGVRPFFPEGSWVPAGKVAGEVVGYARTLLSAERTALNFLNRLSGIATLTRRWSSLVPGKLYDTRKTTPLWRTLEKEAVRLGGGKNHRAGLAEAVLIKDNHLRLVGGVERALETIRRKNPSLCIEVEVTSRREAEAAVRLGADWILVDNISGKTLRRMVRDLRKKVNIEISGGLTKKKLKEYRRLSVQRFSCGALTHSAPAADFSFELFPVGGA